MSVVVSLVVPVDSAGTGCCITQGKRGVYMPSHTVRKAVVGLIDLLAIICFAAASMCAGFFLSV